MFLKSIRWRLQLWYGAILIVVLIGFGITAYRLERSRQLRNLDEQIQRRVAAIANTLRPPLRPGPGERGAGGRGFLERGPEGRAPDGRDRMDRPPGQQLPPNQMRREPGDFPPDDGGPGPRPRLDFRLPPVQAALFDEEDTNAFYYVVWRRDGTELARTSNAPADVPVPTRLPPSERPRVRPPGAGPGMPHTRGSFREAIHFSPPGESAVVGRSLGPELADLRRVAWGLTAAGGIVLLLGLAGGWWIATSAIHPINDISATAVKIAAGDLSQRINAAKTDNELGRLAGVLNSTFARLDAAFSQQARFTSDAAHELRTPVTVMLTQTQTSLNRERNAAEYRETVEACQRAAQRMRRLIESLLELARLDAGQEKLKRMRFNLADTARDCLELIRPIAEPRGITLHGEFKPVECVGDSERLTQVITNLLANAVQYNRNNGEVRMTLGAENGTAVLWVSDTGEGIPAEDVPHVFERFYRADKSRSSTASHTGLGLAISKAIVEAHGGTIEVTSQPDVGATFIVRLPLDSPQQPDRSAG